MSNFCYFHRDLTEFLEESDQQTIGSLTAVYLFDKSRVTHCCELTPSYECHLVNLITGNEVDAQACLYMDCFDLDEVSYFHCETVRGIKDCPNPPVRDMGDFDEEYEDYLERVVEYYRCNSGLLG